MGMPRNKLENSCCCRFFLFLLFFSINGGVLEAWHKGSVTRYYDFKVQSASITKLCKTSTIVTVNGMYPGPTIYAREDDTVVVEVSNLTPYNISIHLHGVRQRLTCWFDGPAYITQCPIQAGQSFKYRFTLLNQRGTLFWHAHISWLRATVHGPLIIYPKQGVGYPFQPPVEEHVIILGEYWLRDVQGLERHVKESGGGPPGSDAYTLNGLLGPLHNCSRDDIYTINVTKGKNYLLRIINAALNMEHFFMVANHTMTVVETDGEYTKPFKTTFLMLTPGQTYNVLIKADQSIGKYFMAMAPYMPAKNAPFLKKTSYGILRYASPTVKVDKLARKSHVKTSMTPLEPIIPNVNDTASVQAFSDQVKRLYPNHQWSSVDVPLRIDKTLFFTIGLNVFSCDSPDSDMLGESLRLQSTM
ncbi:hypothetical protein ES332_D11G212800v1 [Gossypium tomentosum]|uniref:laccase n=1 Tax=Gossypium tomentosum TaxID=34277 RepID=A0A5D2IRQ1_GOSTO|nr:hypothetical protein ES332_D11G212800v1 [Gossypium tomentosum]